MFCPKVSVVIPVYNGANYMREAIDSALAQEYRNIEVVVVNDGSNDGGETERIALSYGDRIRYFSKPNGGVSTALNRGIQEMSGEYFSWLSHDDVYHPFKIQDQIQSLNSIPASARQTAICYSGWDIIDHKSQPVGTVLPHGVHGLANLADPMYALMKGLIHGCSLLIPRSLFEAHGVFDPTLRSTQDYDLWYKMFRKGCALYLSRPGIKSRVHPDQGTHKISDHSHEASRLWIKMLSGLSDQEISKWNCSRLTLYRERSRALKEAKYDDVVNWLDREAARILDQSIKRLKVSVIIPFYNRIPDLENAIQSVLAQDGVDFEVLLVNDGSTDDISSIQRYVDNKKVFLFAQKNAGPAAARNLGLKKSTGDYIAFLDSDDLFNPEKLKTQLLHMLINDSKISHTSYIRKSVGTGSSDYIPSALWLGSYPYTYAKCPIAMPTVMISRDLVQSGDLCFPDHVKIGEDVILWSRLAGKFHILGIDLPLSTVHTCPTSTSQSPEKMKLGTDNIINHGVLRDLNVGLLNVCAIIMLFKDSGFFSHKPIAHLSRFEKFLHIVNAGFLHPPLFWSAKLWRAVSIRIIRRLWRPVQRVFPYVRQSAVGAGHP